ncbi:hypothetical protein K503DRAFT_869842 [Rhizopogon vinicolor AM-OR11-026]|uniref:Uncharacterized protein n=1 Tax=Rhizopogon vinicolor AM-OR11-026 TaxID=1314800 RepID=A0A1B7MK56_9AGAM|nr:hypothetical protein K503DRAFT_869842 [Rhizopogon vinicolor AM-OR11-026]
MPMSRSQRGGASGSAGEMPHTLTRIPLPPQVMANAVHFVHLSIPEMRAIGLPEQMIMAVDRKGKPANDQSGGARRIAGMIPTPHKQPSMMPNGIQPPQMTEMKPATLSGPILPTQEHAYVSLSEGPRSRLLSCLPDADGSMAISRSQLIVRDLVFELLSRC